jgi:hypothetical protein
MYMYIVGGLTMRYEVSKTVWPYMLSIGMAYFVTLCLFPGIESEIVSCGLGTWMPILVMAMFNLFDFIGKVGNSIWSSDHPTIGKVVNSAWKCKLLYLVIIS